MKKPKKKTKSKNKVKNEKKLSFKDILITVINVIIIILLSIAKATLNPAIPILFAIPFTSLCIYVVLFEETSKLKISKFIPEKFKDSLGMYCFFIMIAYIVDLYHVHYVSYRKLLLIICSILISIIIHITHDKHLESNIRPSKGLAAFRITLLSICMAALLSGINTAFPLSTIQTVTAKITNEKTTPKPKRGTNYYIYVDKNSAPSVNNKFSCEGSYYRSHNIGSYASISYKQGLLGLQYAELIE